MRDGRLVLLLFSQLNTLTLASWIDPDTPKHAHATRPLLVEGASKTYALVFSDEFDAEGRTFDDGVDPRWTAMNKNDFTNNPLHYYSHESVQSHNGSMRISLSIEAKNDLYASWNSDTLQSKEFKSGMVQSWNKFCFTGGIVEFSAKMPASSNVAGLWPAIWMMGNLGRATYVNSTENMWPFSTNVCDDRTRDSQLVNSCEDAAQIPGMAAGRGRGAPEIDLLEVMFMDEFFENPILSTSLQVAPGVPDDKRPPLGQQPNASETWYSPEFGEIASRNTYFYGTVSYPADPTKLPYRTDSLSANIPLNEDFYQSFHKFRVEWQPPEESGDGGYVKWFVDEKLVTAAYGEDLQATSQSEIPSEPMYLVMNLAVSKDWGFPDAYFKNCPKKCWSCLDPECACALPKLFCQSIPAYFEIDWVRVYQPNNEPGYSLGCSPRNRPTQEYIEAHKFAYKLPEEENPLKEIANGGASCRSDMDCGTTKRGICSKNTTCVCGANWTGPKCLAPGGFSEWKGHYSISRNSGLEWALILTVLLCVIIVMQWKSMAWNKSEKQIYRILATMSTNGTHDLETPKDSRLPYESYQRGCVPKVRDAPFVAV